MRHSIQQRCRPGDDGAETTAGARTVNAIMIGEGELPVSDETLSAHNAHELHAEMEKSRESAARLLDTFAQKIGAHKAMREAAHYVQAHSVKDVATGLEKAVRSRPAPAIALAVLAGFLVGRALRSR